MQGFISAVCLFGLLLIGTLATGQENADLDLGRAIYELGVGRDGRDISGRVHGNVSLTGASIACAGCHGRDGRGGGEAFVRAPDLRWFSLTKPYSGRRGGTARIPYDRVTFSRALRSGISSEGLRLDPTMPQFDLADDEVGSLITYLETLRTPPSTVEERPVILGLLPIADGNTAVESLAVKLQNCPSHALKSRFAAIDIEYFRGPEDAIARIDARLRTVPHAIILAPYLIGWESLYAEAAKRWNVPTLLPLSLLDPPGGSDWHYRFPGIETQIKSLLRTAKHSGHSHVRLIFDARLPLSVTLKAFSEGVAHHYGLTIEGDVPRKKGRDSQHASLWLRPFSEDMRDIVLRRGELLLVPALFYRPEKNRPPSHKGSEIRLRIAYPYPPRSTKEKVWRTPVDVWAGAACELMARFSEGMAPSALMPGARIRWEQDLFLLARPSEAELIDQVFLADETYTP